MAKCPVRVFHFSGGSSSAKMVIDNYLIGDVVLFCDTGREHPKTYKFINDFEAFEGIVVTRISMSGGWSAMLATMGGVPNRAKRRCTLELKIRTARRYMRSLGYSSYTQFVGFRYDERVRVAKYSSRWQTVTTLFPLYSSGQDKTAIVQYWFSKPYRLEIPSILGNCDLCFNKGEDKVIAILTNDLSLADKWIFDEEDSVSNPLGHTYFKGRTVRSLRDAASLLVSSGRVFDLSSLSPSFSCACTS